MTDPIDVRCEAWKYLPEELRVLAIGCHDVAAANLVPDGWTIEVRNHWLTAVDDYKTVAVRIRPTEVPGLTGDWYGTVDIPELNPHSGPADHVDGTGAVETFRRAVAKYHAARAKAA